MEITADRALSTVRKLRQDLQARRKALRREVKELEGQKSEFDSESEWECELACLGEDLEESERALELVKATERQLAGKGRGWPKVKKGRSGTSAQVRRLDRKLHLHYCYLDWVDACGVAGQGHASGCPQAVLSRVARCRAAASAPFHEGHPHGGVGGPSAAAADCLGGGAAGAHVQGAEGGGARGGHHDGEHGFRV
jgi:hypothetical protein